MLSVQWKWITEAGGLVDIWLSDRYSIREGGEWCVLYLFIDQSLLQGLGKF